MTTDWETICKTIDEINAAIDEAEANARRELARGTFSLPEDMYEAWRQCTGKTDLPDLPPCILERRSVREEFAGGDWHDLTQGQDDDLPPNVRALVLLIRNAYIHWHHLRGSLSRVLTELFAADLRQHLEETAE